MADEMHRLSGLLDDGLKELRDQAKMVATAEAAYRRGKAEAWVRACTLDCGRLAKDLEAWVDATTSDLRHERDLADGLRQAALESVRSRRTQISALQTLANADRAEAEFARVGPS